MPLCGASNCGCALTSSPATTGEINGAFPTIDITGAGTAANPFDVTLDSDWSAEVADALWQDWTEFTPTWSNVTVGSATNSGWARAVPGGIAAHVELILAADSSVTGIMRMNLSSIPFTIAASRPGPGLGSAFFKDSSIASGNYSGIAQCAKTATTIQFPTGGSGTLANATSPMTWATDDFIQFDILIPTDT